MRQENPALTQPPPATSASPAPEETRPVIEEVGVPEAPPAAEVDPAARGAASEGDPVAPAARTANAAEEQPARSPAAWWALLLALIAVGVAGWSIWQAREMRLQTGQLRAEVASRLSDGETIATEARGMMRQQQEVIASLQGKLGALESRVETTQGQAEALEALYQEFSRSREDGVLAEVEQAVALASQQLQIAGNVEAALIGLQEAEARLAIHDRGQLATLRRALVRDIEELRLLPVLDVSGLSLRLELMLERADTLPLAFESPLPAAAAVGAEMGPADGGGFVGWMAGVWRFAQNVAADAWSEIRTLIRVERLDQEDPVLLAPEQNTFLRENLKMRLLTARLALMARDGRSYAADLAQARQWLERFYDLRDERVQAALGELKQLEAVKVRYAPPDLSETFSALRSVQSRAGRSGADARGAAAPAPASAPAEAPVATA
ncbi:MAG TPA: uroporphyrinogen-III C-methyltransferase, partial [Thauera aminoaromatica]|nr:uroporphyrinogen-III C-methyltransferase [Thauera aminoaromatica]HNB07575.1 uroporphyrinogen-III C-methyltransferase [Thauera aminoaromatica]